MGQREVSSPLWEEADSPCALGCGVCGKGVASMVRTSLVQTEHNVAKNWQPTAAVCPQMMPFPDTGGGCKGPDWHRFTPSEWV